MPADDFEPTLGRLRDPNARANLRTTKRFLEYAAKSDATRQHPAGYTSMLHGARQGARSRWPDHTRCGYRIIARACYARQRGGDLGAAPSICPGNCAIASPGHPAREFCSVGRPAARRLLPGPTARP